MLGNCENMVVISSTNNEWPQQHQNNHIDEKSLMAASTGGTGAGGGGRVAEKQIIQDQNQIQLNQQALKCPRCDSSNTKFCYYNNYSLSQPRHFCKACKRYWTRGGTLRNVPVGGGCRKNKRVKRPSSSSSAIDAPSSSSSAPTSNPNPSSIQSHIDLSSTSNHMSSMFYGLHTNPSDLSYSRFNPRVSNVDTVSGFDLQPQLSALGLGFSSEFSGFNTSNPLLSTYPMFGSSATSNSPTMASLLPSSSFHQQKYPSNGFKDLRGGNNSSFHGLAQYQDLQMQANSAGKEVKMEEAQGRINWDLHGQNQTHHHEQQINSSDPNLYWNGSGFGGAWLDPGNIGSSVPSLI